MFATILFSVFLSPIASAQTAQLEKEFTPPNAAKDGAFKEEFNCLSNLERAQIGSAALFTGTHDGKSGFYHLTPKTIHFYSVDKNTYSACFVQGKRKLSKGAQSDIKKKLEDSPKKNEMSATTPSDHPFQGVSEQLNSMRDISHISHYYFKIETAGEKPMLVRHSIDETNTSDAEGIGQETRTRPIQALPKGRTACTLTDHQALDEEAKADLEAEITDYISSIHDIFEMSVESKTDPNFGKIETEESDDKPEDKKSSNVRKPFSISKSKTVLPNPKSYINLINACKGVKSKRVQAAIALELEKFVPEKIESGVSQSAKKSTTK